MENIEKMKVFFQKDAFAAGEGLEICSVTDKESVITAQITEKHLNANGCVQGGMLYTIADFAFAVLSNFLHPMTVTQSGQIQYLRAAVTTSIKAVAKERARYGRNTSCEVIVYDDKDEIVCVCHFSGFIKEMTTC